MATRAQLFLAIEMPRCVWIMRRRRAGKSNAKPNTTLLSKTHKLPHLPAVSILRKACAKRYAELLYHILMKNQTLPHISKFRVQPSPATSTSQSSLDSSSMLPDPSSASLSTGPRCNKPLPAPPKAIHLNCSGVKSWVTSELCSSQEGVDTSQNQKGGRTLQSKRRFVLDSQNR